MLLIVWVIIIIIIFSVFFFKQKTAYEIGVRLVGSEMCIRDRMIPGIYLLVPSLGILYYA